MSTPRHLHLSDRWEHHSDRLAWRSAPTGVRPCGNEPESCDEAREWAASQPGQFASVITLNDVTILVTDFARSIPLFYTFEDGAWVVSDDINLLLAQMDSPHRDSQGAAQFLDSGIVLGDRTLVDGVRQVPAATIVCLPNDASSCDDARALLYRRFRYDRLFANDDQAFETAILASLHTAVRDLVETAGDRLLAIPLSGGIDSRLLALLLAEATPRNLLAFTYGVAGSREALVSEEVARDLGIPWVFVESDPASVAAAWSQHGADFVRNCWAGASLPHYQDWYALHMLTQDGTLPPGSIILPGHTIVGNLHDGHLLNDPAPMSRADFARTVITHHFKVQGAPQRAANLPSVHEEMARFFNEVDYDGAVEERQSLIEWFNIRERQAKYINNSMRPYEFFGLDWALPMLNALVVETWQHGSASATDEERLWYGDFTSRLYHQRTGKDFSYHTSGAASLPPRWKTLGVKAAEATGLATLLRRLLSARTQMHHPMAFQALLGKHSAQRILPRTLKGSSLHGMFIELFLDNRWVDDSPILPN